MCVDRQTAKVLPLQPIAADSAVTQCHLGCWHGFEKNAPGSQHVPTQLRAPVACYCMHDRKLFCPLRSL